MRALPGIREVILVGYYPPPFGGESTHVSQLAQRLRTAHIPTRIINLRRGAPPDPQYERGAGPARLFGILLRTLDPSRLLHMHTNGHSWKSWAMIACAAAGVRLRRAPGLLTLHSGMAPGFFRRIPPVLFPFFGGLLTSFHQVVCVNEDIRQGLLTFGVPPQRISVIPAFLGVKGAFKAKTSVGQFASLRPLLSVTAGTGAEYGLSVLLGALSELRREFRHIGCLVLGTAGEDGSADMAHTLGLGQCVRFLGPLPHEQCLAFVAGSDVFVRPSLADGDAVSVREALQLAVPVVASNTSSRPAGVSLFQLGDSRDLARTLSRVIREGLPRSAMEPTPDYGVALLTLYERVVEAHT